MWGQERNSTETREGILNREKKEGYTGEKEREVGDGKDEGNGGISELGERELNFLRDGRKE